MEPNRWQQIQDIFSEALDHPDASRDAFVHSACGTDAGLLAEVQAMIQADSRTGSLLDRGLPHVAYRIFGGGAESPPVEEIGPYRLKQCLGRGGMGVVWLAAREDTGGALVAIKLLRHAGRSAPRREGFAREIKTLARFKHPFIARLYDAGSLDDGTPWFVMEYVEGAPLTDYSRQHHLPVDAQLRLFRSVCEAVQYAYRQGIIHSDLKPSNILVEKDGTPRLLDFGIAHQLQTGEESEHSTAVLRFGSAQYGAPEWIRDGQVGAYTDVYSLGVILFEMLAGRLPVNPGEDLPQTLPRDLNALCQKARHADPLQRYQSVEELLRDVEHYLGFEPLEARAGGVAYRVSKFVRRNRRSVVVASCVFILVAALVVGFTVRLAKAKNAALAEAARTRRVERFMLNLFKGGDPLTAPSTDLRAVTLIERGARQVASLNSDPQVQAQIYQTLGSMYEVLGDFDKADGLLRSGLDKMKLAFGDESPEFADALAQLGTLRGDQGKFQEAERMAREAWKVVTHRLPSSDLKVVNTKVTLGRILTQRGGFLEAIAILEPVASNPPTGEEASYTLRDCLTTLGNAHYYAGHYAEAEAFDRRAIALDRQLLGKWHPQTGTDLTNLATMKAATGDFTEAEALYREGVEIMTAWYGADHPDTITQASFLGRILLAEGKLKEAQPLLQHVLAIQERAYGPAHPYVAVTLDTLGRLEVARGNLVAAKADFSRCLNIDQSLFGDAHYQTAIARGDLASVLLAEKQYAPAEQMLRQAVDVLSKTSRPGNLNIGVYRALLGRALLKQNRLAEAEEHLKAGYDILRQQPKIYAARLEEARQDLASIPAK